MTGIGSFVVREGVYAPGLRQPRHAHDYSNVTIVLAGRIEEATESGEYVAHPGSVVSKGAGCEHEDRIGGFGARTLSIRFHGESPLEPRSWSWLDSPAVVRHALAVQRACDGCDRESAIMALIEEVTASAAPRTSTAPRWIADMTAALDRDFDRTVRFDALACQFGLHPVYVARAFRRYVGVSMSEYVRAARLRHARRALSSTSRSVTSIAAECGFTDASHMCRTFSHLLGASPAKYRKLTAHRTGVK